MAEDALIHDLQSARRGVRLGLVSARLLLLGATLLAQGCGPSRTPTAVPPPLPSLDEPRAQIRAEMLRHTPPGTSADEVLNFVTKALPPTPGTPPPALEHKPATGPSAGASGHAGMQRIRVVLGEYMPNPALLFQPVPLVIEERVTVQWAFDAQGRLLDVFVDKKAQLGD